MEPRNTKQTWVPQGALSGTDVPPHPELPPPPGPLPPGAAYAGLGVRAVALVVDALASLVVAIPLAANTEPATIDALHRMSTEYPATVRRISRQQVGSATIGHDLGRVPEAKANGVLACDFSTVETSS